MKYYKMVQNIINLKESNDRILNIVKAQHGFKNKNQAVEFIIEVYGESISEPELRPEYIKKLMLLEKEDNLISFKSIKELRDTIENA